MPGVASPCALNVCHIMPVALQLFKRECPVSIVVESLWQPELIHKVGPAPAAGFMVREGYSWIDCLKGQMEVIERLLA